MSFETVVSVLQLLITGLGVLLLCGLIILGVVLSRRKRKKDPEGCSITPLNQKWDDETLQHLRKVLKPKELKEFLKAEKKKNKEEISKPRVFLLDFNGDISASKVSGLREQISTILRLAKKDDEVILRLDSPGGMVSGYGLAASQLERLRKAQIPLTACVDKVAASGGYMMACVADRILCAPFAVVGSIGVLAQVPNFNKLLKKYDVDYFEVTGGEFKRTLTPLGEPTEEKLQKFTAQIKEIHVLFQQHVTRLRPQVVAERVMTGEYWFGLQAQELGLIDALATSDELLFDKSKEKDIFLVEFAQKENPLQKLLTLFG